MESLHWEWWRAVGTCGREFEAFKTLAPEFHRALVLYAFTKDETLFQNACVRRGIHKGTENKNSQQRCSSNPR